MLRRHEELRLPVRAEMLDVARLAAAPGAGHVMFLPAMYRDLSEGRAAQKRLICVH